MRKSYKDVPIDKPNPLFPDKLRWEPMLAVRLGYHHARSPRTFAFVDSGSPYCLFPAAMATMIGLDYIKNPVYTEEIGGIVRGMSEPFYFHKISLYVEADWRIDVIAGFSKKLNASGILGRTGFFDSFKITFDHSWPSSCVRDRANFKGQLNLGTIQLFGQVSILCKPASPNTLLGIADR